MGWGDEIMATAHARRLYEAARKPVRIVDRNGTARWNEIWENNPCIAAPGRAGDVQLYRNGGHCRPYVSGVPGRFIFRPGTMPGPGEIHFSDRETQRIAARRKEWPPFAIIEPNVKVKASPNKQWGWARYQALVALCRDVHFVQIGPAGTRCLPGVDLLKTQTFREAAMALACASAYVGAEGGLHHAAAALGIPAVVIFGGFIAPSVTGYERPRGAVHVNLYAAAAEYPNGCGAQRPCNHCRDAMASIAAERVATELRAVLAARPT